MKTDEVWELAERVLLEILGSLIIAGSAVESNELHGYFKMFGDDEHALRVGCNVSVELENHLL